MIIAITADQHVANHRLHGGPLEAGLNRRCRASLGCLTRAVEVARGAGAEWMIGGGDLFDAPDPTPPVVAAVRVALAPMARVSLILGNHEISTDAPGDSATEVLGCLGDDDAVEVYREPRAWGLPGPWRDGRTSVLLVPHDPTRTSLEALRAAAKAVPAAYGVVGLVVVHMGIYDDTDPDHLHGDRSAHIRDVHETLQGTRAAEALVVAGDWHRHRVLEHEGTTAIQVGALCPVGWRDPGPDGYGSVILIDTSDWTWRRVEVPGPRFLQGTADEVADALPLHSVSTVYARITDDGEPPAGLALVERPPAKRGKARAAGTRTAPTVEAAAKAWCEQHGKPEAIADRALGLLAAARAKRSAA